MIKLNGQEIEFKKFPNGETLIDTTLFDTRHGGSGTIELLYENDQDLIHLMFLKRHLDTVWTNYNTKINLRIRYMPYSRMDRQIEGTVFTLKYVTDFINSLTFCKVIVGEPHSDVTTALLNNCLAQYPTIKLLPEVLFRIGFDQEKDFLFFPDAGAQKRYASLTGYNTAVGFKHRDPQTGKLDGKMDIVGGSYKKGYFPKFLIVDDICSFGGTFVIASKHLKPMADKIYLFVAHCEESVFQGELFDHIDGLFCTDSILSSENSIKEEKLHIYSNGRWI